MALQACRECGKEVSTRAKTCPNCGIKAPGRKSPDPKMVLAIALGLVAITMVGIFGDPSAGTTREARPERPGVERVGEEEAARLWRNVTTTSGVHVADCRVGADICTIRITPALWNQMPYDLKRDFTAGAGIGASHMFQASWTSVQNHMTGQELASYSTRHDNVTVK
jgi:hypothetical protein